MQSPPATTCDVSSVLLLSARLLAAAAAAAVTPPGFYTVPGSGVTLQCPSGSYRAKWAAAGLATQCSSCGAGVFVANDAVVERRNISNPNVTTTIPVATLPASCCKCVG